MIQGTKIVTPEEMRRIEQLCFNQGMTSEELMDRAAESLVSIVKNWFQLSKTPREVILLVGKGNNGGDALTVGTLLLQQKFHVSVILVYPPNDLSSLCQARLEQFKQAGGILLQEKQRFYSLIVDGIVGTGFHGKPDTPMKQAIAWANSQDAAILSIDIPSGVDGTTGRVDSIAIDATMTCALGFPKIGCFIGQGWEHTGALLTCDINLPAEIAAQAKPESLLLQKESLLLPPLVRTRHKYEAGYVLGVSGSPQMPGAAALSSLAVLRSGAGMIRLFTQPETPRSLFPMEVICETIDLKRIKEEMKRSSAIFIGPGLGRSPEIQKVIQKLLPLLNHPTVIDGDGLYHLATLKEFSLPVQSVLTPHHGEMIHLLGEAPTLENCQRWVEKHQVTLILKGAPTLLFHPAKVPLMITVGDPGMATAGSGDVLTGMVAAFLAQGMPADTASALATYLHGRAGELAAEKWTSYSMIASDLIASLPDAFKELS